MTLDIQEIEKLMKALEQYGLTELKLEQDDFTLKLSRGGSPHAGPHCALPDAVRAEGQAAGVPAASEPVLENAPGTVVRSPIVGTFYACPTPDADPFKQVGDGVRKGDVLFIIESMKLMNEVTSEYEGVVAEVLAQSGDPVEYGQPLMRIV